MIQSSVFFILGLSLSGCMQAENSSSGDADTYGAGGAGVVKNIFVQNCTPCHDYQTKTKASLIAAGLIVASDPVNSKIYYRLVGSKGSNPDKNMPLGSELSSSQIQQIEDWILNAE